MFKVIKIGKKAVKMKSNGRTARLYAQYTGRDLLVDFIKISTEKTENLSQVLEDFAWVMAKTADESIPNAGEWLEQFEMMDLTKAYGDVMEMMGASMKSSVKPKKNNQNKKKKRKHPHSTN